LKNTGKYFNICYFIIKTHSSSFHIYNILDK
jgi:hypothetical protein